MFVFENIKNYSMLSVYGFALCVMGGALPLSETAKQIAIILILISGLLYIVRNNVRFSYNIIDLSVVLIFLSHIMSVLFAIKYYDSIGVGYDYSREFHSLYATLRVCLVFIIARYLPIDHRVKMNLLILLLISYFVSLLIGEYKVAFGLKRHIELKGIGHVNHSSLYSCMIFFVAITLSFFCKKKYLYYFVCVLAFIAVMQSGSRATMISLVVTLFTYLLYKNVKFLHSLIILSLFMLLFYFVASINDYTFAKIKLGFHDPARIFIWKISITEWLKHNILFGIGPDNSYYINPLTYGKKLGLSWKVLGHSHNTFLSILLETGLFGLFSYLLFTISIFVKLVSIKNRNVYVLIGICVAMVNFINSFANTTFNSSNAELMVLLWAMALNEPKNINLNGDREQGNDWCGITAASR